MRSRGATTLAELERARPLGRRARPRGRDGRPGLERPRAPTTASTLSSCGSRGSSRPSRSTATSLRAGGGASNAVCLHRARAAGLGGLEFACAIPGHRGWGRAHERGRVRIGLGGDPRAGARRLGRGQRLADRRRARARVPALRRCGPDRSSPRSSTGSRHGRPMRSRRVVAELVAQRKATQPTNKRTFGSVFKNPPGELGAGRMLELCRLKGHRIGGALVSPRHANFIENAGDATTADCLALIAEARRRAREQFGVELEQEVVVARGLSRRSSRRARKPRPRRTTSRGRQGTSRRSERPRARTESVVVPFPRTTPAIVSSSACSFPPAARSCWRSRVLAGILLALLAARETSIFGVRTIEVSGADRRRTAGRAGARRAARERASSAVDLAAARASRALPTVAAVAFDRAFPHTLPSASCPNGRSR